MAHVHIIQTKSDSKVDVEAFSSKAKAMKKYKYYITDFSNQTNIKLRIQETSFSAVRNESEEKHIFSAEYKRTVIR